MFYAVKRIIIIVFVAAVTWRRECGYFDNNVNVSACLLAAVKTSQSYYLQYSVR